MIMLIYRKLYNQIYLERLLDLEILISIQEGNLAEIEMWLLLGESTEVTGQWLKTPIMFASQVMLSFNKCSDRHFI